MPSTPTLVTAAHPWAYLQYAMASCYIPVYSGRFGDAPWVDGHQLMDGGFSNNLVRFPGIKTITISPFSSDADISPRDVNLFDWTMTIANQRMKVCFFGKEIR